MEREEYKRNSKTRQKKEEEKKRGATVFGGKDQFRKFSQGNWRVEENSKSGSRKERKKENVHCVSGLEVIVNEKILTPGIKKSSKNNGLRNSPWADPRSKQQLRVAGDKNPFTPPS